jgi:predicted amidohydrolase YtcJ
MGAGTPRMFAELRLPTLAELDAAVPDRPVFLYQGGGGPARTNTLGKQFFESATAPLAGPCVVGDDGSLINTGGVNHANRALYHLRVRQTFEDKKRSALDAMAFSASVGVNALGRGGDGDPRPGLARSPADARALHAQPLLPHVRCVAGAARRGPRARPPAAECSGRTACRTAGAREGCAIREVGGLRHRYVRRAA